MVHDVSDADSHFGVQLADSRPVPLCPLRPRDRDGERPPAARRMMRSQAQVWLGLAGDPLRALPTHTGTSTAFRCSACNVICSGTVYMARDRSFCCENHRDRQFLKRGQPDSPLRPRSTSPPAREPAPSWRDYPQP